MELGQRLRQARLEAGLSQRQLCADTVTRNMLSQIENGQARPSMDTLCRLAKRLGRPVSFFLGESAEESGNAACLQRAYAADAAEVPAILRDYRAPDEANDAQRYFLEASARMTLARRALSRGNTGQAREELAQVRALGEKTKLYTEQTERARILLCYEADADTPQALSSALPTLDTELLLRADAALREQKYDRCIALVQAMETPTAKGRFFMGEALLAQGKYREAIACYQDAEAEMPLTVYRRLEECYRAVEDYKQAYFYACKQR